MLARETLGRILADATETTAVDFKLRLDWATKQLEVVRDLVCFANRSGGGLVIGVRQEKGRKTIVGMSDDDPLPDVNEVANLLRKYFERAVPITVVPYDFQGKQVGVLSIEAFTTTPIVAARNGGNDQDKPIIRRGAIYRRTDGASCEEAGPAEIAQLLEACVERRVAEFRSMLSTVPPSLADTITPRVGPISAARPADASLGRFASLRSADLIPTAAPSAGLRLRELELLLEQCAVRGAGHFPRNIDRAGGEGRVVVRAPGQLAVRTESDVSSDSPFLSLIEMRKDGVVSVRESLWEDARLGPDRKLLGILATIRFTLSALVFGYRFFSAIAVGGFTVRIGLLGPEGRSLLRDWDDAWPFFERYAATSPDDLLIVRRLRIEDLDTADKRADAAFSIVDEFFDFFGYVLERKDFDQLAPRSGVHVEVKPPAPIRPVEGDTTT